MIEVMFSEELKNKYNNAAVGILLIKDIINRDPDKFLEKIKKETEEDIIRNFSELSRDELNKKPVFAAYRNYFRKFKKTYQLLLQLESVAKKGRSFPAVNPLADSCFLAEMKTFVLTAGHDADLLDNKILFDLSKDNDGFTRINGESIILKPVDIIMKSGGKNICSVIYGQDNSTLLSEATENAFYVSYAPEGVPDDAVMQNLEIIESCVSLFSPGFQTEVKNIYSLSC